MTNPMIPLLLERLTGDDDPDLLALLESFDAVGGIDLPAGSILDRELAPDHYVVAGKIWHHTRDGFAYTGEWAADALIGDGCPADFRAIADLREYARSGGDGIWEAFLLMVMPDADFWGEILARPERLELAGVGSTDAGYLGDALVAWASVPELAEVYARALVMQAAIRERDE